MRTRAAKNSDYQTYNELRQSSEHAQWFVTNRGQINQPDYDINNHIYHSNEWEKELQKNGFIITHTGLRVIVQGS